MCFPALKNANDFRLLVRLFCRRGFCHVGDSFAPVALWAIGRNLTGSSDRLSLLLYAWASLVSWQPNFLKRGRYPCRRSTLWWSPLLSHEQPVTPVNERRKYLKRREFSFSYEFLNNKVVGKADKVFLLLFFSKQNHHLSCELYRPWFLGKTTILLKCQGEILHERTHFNKDLYFISYST